MTDLQRISLEGKNVEEAIASLKKWSYLLKYGRMGKPKFCPFRLSSDETTIIWCVKKEEKQLPLTRVSRIIPGQRTAVFQRYPQPEKEYQSFSLLYGNRSLDVICKDKNEAEIWFVALQALISRNDRQISRSAVKANSISSDGSSSRIQRKSQSISPNSSSDILHEDSGKNETYIAPIKNKTLGRAFSDMLLYTESGKNSPKNDNLTKSYGLKSYKGQDCYPCIPVDNSQSTLSGAVSSSSKRSILDDLHDIYIWGEGTGDGLLGGGIHRLGTSCSVKMDALFPKALKPNIAFDARKVSCGSRHAVVVTKQGEIYSWGEGSGGKLGHGVETDVSTPKLINKISKSNIQLVACGENYTCALTQSGDLYTWGDGINDSISYWIPKEVNGQIDGLRISLVSCGPWHSAIVTSLGKLFTFGDGTFGALGHGNTSSTYYPKPVETLKHLTVGISCGFWHTAAIVEVDPKSSTSSSSCSKKLFTWGNGDEGQLGHDDKDPRFLPSCVALLSDKNLSQVACGHSMTVALTTSGEVYTMGGENNTDCNLESKLKDCFIEEISCGSHHVAVLTSKSDVYTWGKGGNGQLGHGDNKDRSLPTLVEALGEIRVKSVVCGYNVTVAICVRKHVCTADLSVCSSCHAQFSFKRKRHNCYNCGLVFCKPCSSRKSLKASLAPNTDKPYRVCNDCYHKLRKEERDSRSSCLPPKVSRFKINRKSGSGSGSGSGSSPCPSKSRGLFSRLSNFDSFKRAGNSFALPSKTRSFRREYSYTTNSSPVLEYSEPTGDDSKRKNDNLIKEISTLREQVEYLLQKTEILESELKTASMQLKEATKQARDEEEKNKAAEDKIKSLTAELETMTTLVGQGSSPMCRVSDTYAGRTFRNSGRVSIKRQLTI